MFGCKRFYEIRNTPIDFSLFVKIHCHSSHRLCAKAVSSNKNTKTRNAVKIYYSTISQPAVLRNASQRCAYESVQPRVRLGGASKTRTR